MKDLQIKIQVRSVDGKDYPEHMQQLSDFVMANVEQGIAELGVEVMAFSPHTGEPLMCAPQLNLDVAKLIAAISVISPTAVTTILQNEDALSEPEQITMEPILMSPYFGDDNG
jgi:hypothetical protein